MEPPEIFLSPKDMIALGQALFSWPGRLPKESPSILLALCNPSDPERKTVVKFCLERRQAK